MAKITKGLLGGFSGKVGTVVGYTLYGIDRMRSLPDRTAPPTVNELKNRSRFKLIQEVVNCIKDLVKVGFKDYWTVSGGTRAALSYNRRFALKTNEEADYIDPAQFKISGGTLPGLTTAVVVQEREDMLRFSWNPANIDGGSPYDQVMLLAIDMQDRKAAYQCTGNFRSSGTDVLQLPEALKGKEVDVYIAVVAKDRCSQSESQYLGRLRLQEEPELQEKPELKEETGLREEPEVQEKPRLQKVPLPLGDEVETNPFPPVAAHVRLPGIRL
ncbi:hypothetical protein SAMN05421820_10490 [Pedobacter steynii]|uniref:Uncharacterized protein n=1 Tax=Pedobacter steynii TaxID=430522 RepID=A0A1G9U840_9SPHI|nr:DUF6266 family protein [Pedobacter steynii]NQX40686.1 hypothetical protein [Pedobacter steynii]SDM55982.1 hypothetical protein SAMN05421820_10490 [Pedobacter steynii]